jgi:hypothetical protein
MKREHMVQWILSEEAVESKEEHERASEVQMQDKAEHNEGKQCRCQKVS